MKAYEVVILAGPEAQIRRISSWWAGNRPTAPRLFGLELTQAFELLSSSPRCGSPYDRSPIGQLRRVPLRRSRYHLYYTIDDASETVVVRAV